MRKLQFRVTIDHDLLEWLKEEASSRRISASQVIREWIMDAKAKRESNK